MKSILKVDIPQKSIISNDFGKIDYVDSYRITKPVNESIEKITDHIFRLPQWAIALMNLRNSLVKPFGLKTDNDIKNEDGRFFAIIGKNDDEIAMGESDKHLNFRTSVLVDKELSYIYLSTIVHYNNNLGKLYFLFVKPFHRIIIKSLLRRELK